MGSIWTLWVSSFRTFHKGLYRFIIAMVSGKRAMATITNYLDLPSTQSNNTQTLCFGIKAIILDTFPQ